MASKKKSAARAQSTTGPAPSSSAPYRPRLGDVVELELLEGHVVRNPLNSVKHESGDRVNWTTYYARRARDGALRPTQFVPTNDSAGDPVGAREETDQ